MPVASFIVEALSDTSPITTFFGLAVVSEDLLSHSKAPFLGARGI